MDNDAEIKSVLTADEWAAFGSYKFGTGSIGMHGGARSFVFDDGHGDCEWPKLIALANDALPDGSPYKITRDMLNDLASCSGFVYGEGFCALSERVDKLYDALAALLRPEPTTTPGEL